SGGEQIVVNRPPCRNFLESQNRSVAGAFKWRGSSVRAGSDGRSSFQSSSSITSRNAGRGRSSHGGDRLHGRNPGKILAHTGFGSASTTAPRPAHRRGVCNLAWDEWRRKCRAKKQKRPLGTKNELIKIESNKPKGKKKIK